MLDLTKTSNRHFLQLLKANSNYATAIATATDWKQVVNVIDSLNIKYTKEQLEYVKEKEFINN